MASSFFSFFPFGGKFATIRIFFFSLSFFRLCVEWSFTSFPKTRFWLFFLGGFSGGNGTGLILFSLLVCVGTLPVFFDLCLFLSPPPVHEDVPAPKWMSSLHSLRHSGLLFSR